MNRSVLGWIVAAVVVLGGGALAWLWFAGGSGEPSTELTTPTIAGSDTTVAPETTEGEGSTGDTSTTMASETGARAFVIDSGQSTAAFEIDEELRGSPNLVVGTTDQVAGQVVVDPSDLSSAEFSDIVVNARTFETDSGRRDRAIRGPVILNSASDEFEFVTFEVSSVTGLDGEATPGESIEFSVTGDLTVKGTTNEETFDVTAIFVDDETIEGSATTTVSRSDYDIGIPSVPGVANVSDEVLLRLDFVASTG